MKTVHIATASYPISSFDHFEHWRSHTARWVSEAAATGAQLLVFPEYGSIELLSLFPVNVQADIQQNLTALQPMLDDFCGTFADLAIGNGLTLVAPSLPVWVADKFINRAHVFGKAGLAGWQDKFFMTRFEGEDWGISSSEKVLTLFQADWGSFGVQICYDVEFPLGSAGLCAAGAELIAVPSCTETIRGATRVHVGARARALENQCYTVVAQTVGEAPWSPVVDINFGYGAVYSPPDAGLPEEGIVALHPRNTAGWLDCRLDLGLLADVRRDGQVLNFRDGRQQQINWAGEQVALRTAKV